ncbi:hypothetical protein [Achromobacter spanius]|uniref:hypothetical protein n=1 Tax=Achromobacter spanius TaxID=217203 RepID=UPI00382E150D
MCAALPADPSRFFIARSIAAPLSDTEKAWAKRLGVAVEKHCERGALWLDCYEVSRPLTPVEFGQALAELDACAWARLKDWPRYDRPITVVGLARVQRQCQERADIAERGARGIRLARDQRRTLDNAAEEIPLHNN